MIEIRMKVVKSPAQTVVDWRLTCRSPTAERSPVCRPGRLAMACKAVAVGRMDRSRRTPADTEWRSVGTPMARTDLAGTGSAYTRTDSPAEAPLDRSRAHSDRLCCRRLCLAPK